MTPTAAVAPGVTDDFRPGLVAYLAIGLFSGSLIALQLALMRMFSVGGWAHVGSLVVSLVMLSFGLASVAICTLEPLFERHWRLISAAALVSFGPLTIAANLAAQQLPFTPLFLVSDPSQRWRLVEVFAVYLPPFIAGAVFLGCVFLKAGGTFSRIYFADLVGSGLGGLLFLSAMYFVGPQYLILIAVALWTVASILWFQGQGSARAAKWAIVVGASAAILHVSAPELLNLPNLTISAYKGVSHARRLPDARRVHAEPSPFGFIEVYSSSYLHFAPGLSDNAAFNVPQLAKIPYLALFVDGDGPTGIVGRLSAEQARYFRYLPSFYPYLIKPGAEAFVVEFGGGLSTMVALSGGSRSVTIANSNPAVLNAFHNSPALREFTGDLLGNRRIQQAHIEGRLFLAHTTRRYDVIDLSLADSVGLSNADGFSVVEKYAYTREAFVNYIGALKPDGVLSITIWNKEEPPKGVLKLYATIVAASRSIDPGVESKFFVAANYLSTTTILYKRNGFTPAEIATLRSHTKAMSFDEIYSPGFSYSASGDNLVLHGYSRDAFFGTQAAEEFKEPVASESVPPTTVMERLAWHDLVFGGWERDASVYAFDTRVLTNDRPYFAAYIRPQDLVRVLDRLEQVQDEWGYLLLWATLGTALIGATVLVLLPIIFGWRTMLGTSIGKVRSLIFFACLGLGYIMVEVALISHFVLLFGNTAISAAVLLSGMLLFSGMGSLTSEYFVQNPRTTMTFVFLSVASTLLLFSVQLSAMLDSISEEPLGTRLALSALLIAPLAFLMGFPMPTALNLLGRSGRRQMFVWAWGINGCFSVVGAAAVPLIATSFGLSSVLLICGAAYLLAMSVFQGILVQVESPTDGVT